MDTWVIVAVIVCLALIVGVTLAVRRAGAGNRAVEPAEPEVDESTLPRAAVIVNPSKFDDVESVRREVTAQCRAHNWATPLWIETTVDDPGTGQARYALSEKVEVVCALGGDGTVRAVASELVGTGVPLGLLPGGTGNLLARNLDLPIDSLAAVVAIALTGHDRAIDVGQVRYELIPEESTDNSEQPPQQRMPSRNVEEYFLVMAGLGFDASMIADAPEKLKSQIGYGAYVVSGLRHLYGARFDVYSSVDDGPRHKRKARTVLFANVGGLQGGITLMPAAADDGKLDAMILSPRAIVGWASVAMHVLSRHRLGSPLVERVTFEQMKLRLTEPQHMQLDGDAVGRTRAVDVSVVPSALVVRAGLPRDPTIAGPEAAVELSATGGAS